MALTLRNDQVEIVIDEADGGVIRRLARPGKDNVLAERRWATPVAPASSTSYGDERLDFLAGYSGGWHETFPNYGGGGTVLGVPIPFHGDVARAQWSVIDATSDSVEMECASRLPVILSRRVQLDGSVVRLEETARADADIDVPILWGHHPIFAVQPGMRIDLPGGQIRARAAWQSDITDIPDDATGTWPNLLIRGESRDLASVPDHPVTRLACVHNPPGAWAALRDPSRGAGVALSWDAAVFGNLWIWLETGSTDFPWYGRARFLGLEPQSAATPDGLAVAVAEGTALAVPGRGALSAWLTVSLFDADDAPVTQVSQSGEITTARDHTEQPSEHPVG